MYSDGLVSTERPVSRLKDSSSNVLKKVKLGCGVDSAVPAVEGVISAGRAVGLMPATMPKLAMAPAMTPTINPLTCEALNSGVSADFFLVCEVVRRVALPVFRLRLVLVDGFATITSPQVQRHREC